MPRTPDRQLAPSLHAVCASCGVARDKGLNCSATKPFCCASGACAASQAACKVLVTGKDVAKYRAFHVRGARRGHRHS